MSQDLFAEFGGPKEEQKSAAVNIGAAGATSTLFDDVEDDDDFGDFEDASVPVEPAKPKTPSKPKKTPVQPKSPPVPPKDFPPKTKPLPFNPKPKEIVADGRHPFAAHMDLLFDGDDDEYDAGADEITDLANNPEAAMAYSKKIIAQQQEEQRQREEKHAREVLSSLNADEMPLETKANKQSTQKPPKTPPKDPNVLFDADNVSEEDDDDFGDFEAGTEAWQTESPKAEKKPTETVNTSAFDLLNLDDSPNAWAEAPPAPKSTKNTNIPPSRTPAPRAVSMTKDDDPWDDFEEAEPAQERFSDSIDKSVQTPPAPILNMAKANTKNSSKEEALPPTNVPPPAILLSIVPSIFASTNEALFKPLSKLDMKQRQMLLAHPATLQFLRGYLNIAIVIAHIIAGRKLRWKRDQYLAQGMRIGAAGRGMKLAGIDKSEVAKEDREVLDVVRQWKEQAGKLRGAVTSASTVPGSSKLPGVPDIAEQMPVKVLKSGEGGFTAPAACALCGLKREERVLKVDIDVDDTFGEWWVQNMSMHVQCRDFWEEHKGKLKSR